MVPREGENMRIPLSTPNEEDRKITKVRGQETTTTTSKPIYILSLTHYKKSNKSPSRGGKHRVSKNSH